MIEQLVAWRGCQVDHAKCLDEHRAGRYLSSQVGHECSVHLGLGFGLVDPSLGRHGRRSRSATEPSRVGLVGRRQGLLEGVVYRGGGPEMHRRRGMPPDPGMAMNVIVLVKELRQELLRVSQ